MGMGTSFFTARQGRQRVDIALLVLCFGAAYFLFLGHMPLLGTDEARYLEIPREMLERGDLLTPTLNYVPYFEKPPLHYWLNAAAITLFGETPFAARCTGALSGLAGIVVVYHLARQLFGRREGLLSALVLGTSIGVVIQGRVNITDTTLTICLTASLGAFLLASRPDQRRKGLHYHLFYLFAALAVLAKGLVGVVLPGGIVLLYLAFSRRWHLLREMRLGTGMLLFFLTAAPWFILVSLQNPSFPRFFFIHEHFERYLTKGHGRYQPAWYYLPVLFGSMLPWSFFLPGALIRFWRNRPRCDAALYLTIWAGFIVAFFSLSSSKLIPYILPVYPALAVLVGCALSDALDRSADFLSKPVRTLAALHLTGGCGILLYPLLAQNSKLPLTGAMLIGTTLLVQGGFAWLNHRRGQLPALLYQLAFVSFILSLVAPPIVQEGIARRKLTRDLALKVKALAEDGDIIASFGYEQELPLYTKRRVVVVGEPGELEFGSRQGEQRGWFLRPEEFAPVWSGTRQVFALVAKEDVARLNADLKPSPSLLGVQGRRALISNRPEPNLSMIGRGTSAADRQADSTRWGQRRQKL